MTKEEILSVALRQTAVDCSCREEDFLRQENVVVESFPAPDARKDLAPPPHLCHLVSYGNNIVASCRRDLMPEVEAFINGAEKVYRCFETPAVYDLNRILAKAGARVWRMHTSFLPDPEKIYGAELSCPYEIRELHPEDFTELYVPEWSNALSSDRKHLDMLGTGAYDGGRLIGLAGCSADGMDMWQIGIDVLPAYRGQGVASALTNRLARAVFERGKMPFYCASWSNVRSLRNGIRSGFRPAWVELTAKAEEA